MGKWGVQDLNLRRQCHQIYSLTPLTTRETPLGACSLFVRQPDSALPTVYAQGVETSGKIPGAFVYELAEGLEPTTC
jgi:hypothetical protein